MSTSRRINGLAAIALLRLSENELRRLHSFVREISSHAFVEVIRDIEDEVGEAVQLSLGSIQETYLFNVGQESHILQEIDNIRKIELRITVRKFSELLSRELGTSSKKYTDNMPVFDARRGLQNWIIKVISEFGEQEVFAAILRIRKDFGGKKRSDWSLR